MPKLPTYNSQGKLSTDAPEVMRSGAEKVTESAMGVLDTTIDVAKKWHTVQQNMQETVIKAKHAEAVAQIEAEAVADTDIDGAVKKVDALKKATSTLLGETSDPQLRSQLAFELEHSNQISSIKISTEYAKKKMFVDAIETDKLIEGYAKNRSDAVAINSPKLVDFYDKKTEELIKGKVASGLMTEAQGRIRLKDYRLGAVKYDIQSDPSTTQKGSAVLSELQKGSNGRYGNLSRDEIADMIKEAKINIGRNSLNEMRARKETYANGAISLAQQLAAQTLTPLTINGMLQMGQIDANIANIYDNALTAKAASNDTDDGTANYLVKALGSNNLTALEVINEATRLWSDNKIKDDAYAWIIQQAKIKLDREKKGHFDWGKVMQDMRNATASFLEFLSGVNISEDSEMANSAMHKLIEKTNSGTDPAVAAQEAKRETVLELHPQAILYGKEGKTVIDPDGNMKIINSLGDILDAEDNTTDAN